MTLRVTLGEPTRPLSILCLGAHSDDIEIGCAGTLSRLLEEHPRSTVHWVVFSSDPERAAEARASAAELLSSARTSAVEIHSFRESFFPYDGALIKERFESLKSVSPDIVFTHRTADLHQDHRTIAELTWNTFRDHQIAEYEVPKYDGDLGSMNLYVPLTAVVARRKIELLLRNFPSQLRRRWFRAETFEAAMRLRGIECNAPDGFAEAFYARKLVV